MAWEHKIAQELKKRNNPSFPPYLTGEVLSPVRTEDPETQEYTYEGPLIVSIYDGRARLQADNLVVLKHCGQLYKGQTVALLGEQKFIVLGVV